MALTRAQKERLIRQFKAATDERLMALTRDTNTICNSCENRINRKLNTVSVTLWNSKIKDILQVERDHKPSTKSLLTDIQRLQVKQVKNRKSLKPK